MIGRISAMEPMDSDVAMAGRERGRSALVQAMLTAVASVRYAFVCTFFAMLVYSSAVAAQSNAGTVVSLEHQATDSEKPAVVPTTAPAQPTPSPQAETPVVNTVAPPPAPPTPLPPKSLKPVAPAKLAVTTQTKEAQESPVQSAASAPAGGGESMIMVVGISVAIVVVVVLGIVILVAMRKKPSAPMVLGAAQGGVSAEAKVSTPERPEASLIDVAQVTGRASIQINADIVVIGRSRQNTDVGQQAVVLPVRTVGRRHAAIEYRNHAYMLVDQGSVNGTFLNNKQITAPTVLHDGDVIRLESAELTFSLPVERESERTMMAPAELEPAIREQADGGKGLIEQMMERGGPDDDSVAAIPSAAADGADESDDEIDQDSVLTEAPGFGAVAAAPSETAELDGGITVAPEVELIRDSKPDDESSPRSGDWSLNSGVTTAPDFEVVRNAKKRNAGDKASEVEEQSPSSHTVSIDTAPSEGSTDNFDAAQAEAETEDERLEAMRSEDTQPDVVARAPVSQDASVSDPSSAMDSDIEAMFAEETQDLAHEETSPRDAEASEVTTPELAQSSTGTLTESPSRTEAEFGPTSTELVAITSEHGVDLDLGFDELEASRPETAPDSDSTEDADPTELNSAVPSRGRPRAWLHDLDNCTRTPSFEIIHDRISVGRTAPSRGRTGDVTGAETEYLVIRRNTIGRKHASVGFEDGAFYVEDLQSINGTYVNGERADGRLNVANGDEITFDEFRFRLVIEVPRP